MAKRILVAENDKLNMRLFRDVLTHRGYETIERENGLAALEAARAAPPDLILLDVQLPGISGIELTGRVKADPALARVPIVAVGAFTGKANEARIRAAGVDDFVTKPVAPSRLLAAVERHLARAAVNGYATPNGSGNGAANMDEVPPARPWTIVDDFAAQKPKLPEPNPPKPTQPESGPAPFPPAPPPESRRASEPPSPAEASATIEPVSLEAADNALLATALSFTGAFLALALSPAAGGLEGLSDLYVVHFPLGTVGLSPGRQVVWQRQEIGHIVRVELDPAPRGGLRVVVQLDRKPVGFESATATIRNEAIIGQPYIELRPPTAASARLEPRGSRAVSALRPLRAEVEREIENLPRWFERAAAMVQGAAEALDRRDTAALARAVRRIAPLMKAIGGGANGLGADARASWIEDVSQMLAESRDLIGLLAQIAERMEEGRSETGPYKDS